MTEGIPLYVIKKDVVCLKCGNKGAVQSFGEYYSNGLKEKAISPSLEEYRNKEFMSRTLGFGGTLPHECLNCDHYGLIDFGGLEGFVHAFNSIPLVKK